MMARRETSRHNEAGYTDAVLTLAMPSESCTIGGSPYTNVCTHLIGAEPEKRVRLQRREGPCISVWVTHCSMH
jgi:hypothetical protein